LFSFINGNVVYDERHSGAISLRIDSWLPLSTLKYLSNDIEADEAGVLDLYVLPGKHDSRTPQTRLPLANVSITKMTALQSLELYEEDLRHLKAICRASLRLYSSGCMSAFGRIIVVGQKRVPLFPTRLIDAGGATNSSELPRLVQGNGLKESWWL
jgi:hypothetical protein